MNLSQVRRFLSRYFVISALLPGLGVGISGAQTPTGSVNGLVNDVTGAVVQGAHVTATNIDTMVNYNTNTTLASIAYGSSNIETVASANTAAR